MVREVVPPLRESLSCHLPVSSCVIQDLKTRRSTKTLGLHLLAIMPGTIRVSVLEAVELPEIFSDGMSGKDVTAKVTLGTRQFKSESRVAEEGRIDSWDSNFSFLVTNLRDKLVVAICDNEDQCLTQTSIEVPSIIEKGSRDEFVELKGGGRIHLSMSFVLTDEERKKIELMRLAVFRRREEERSKRTIVFENVQPFSENDLEAASASSVTITEVDYSSTVENKVSQETANGPLGFGSTTKPLTPILMFDYAKAVGLQSRQGCKRRGKKTEFWAAVNASYEVEASIDDSNSEEQTARVSAKNQVEVGSAGIAIAGSSVLSSKSSRRAASSLTSLTDSATSLTVSPSIQDSSTGKVSSGAVKINVDVLGSTLSKGRDEFVVPANVLEEGQRVWSGLDSEPAVVANSSILFGGDMRKIDYKGGPTHFNCRNLTQRWGGQQAVRAGHIGKEILKVDVPSGHCQRLEARPGPGARWAQKTGLETRWASPEKARLFVRAECNGQVSASFKARARILKLLKAAAGSHEAYGDGKILQERHSLSDSIGAVLNKVVSGTAILLAALFMMWPLAEDSLHGSDRSSGDV